jgi:hypothetical protein
MQQLPERSDVRYSEHSLSRLCADTVADDEDGNGGGGDDRLTVMTVMGSSYWKTCQIVGDTWVLAAGCSKGHK